MKKNLPSPARLLHPTDRYYRVISINSDVDPVTHDSTNKLQATQESLCHYYAHTTYVIHTSYNCLIHISWKG